MIYIEAYDKNGTIVYREDETHRPDINKRIDFLKRRYPSVKKVETAKVLPRK